jgi:hypothetical protein
MTTKPRQKRGFSLPTSATYGCGVFYCISMVKTGIIKNKKKGDKKT